MPNHITNILTVSGSPEEVERFRVTVSSENPDLIKLNIEKAQRTIKLYEEAEDKSNLGFDADRSYEIAKEIVSSGKIPETIFTFEGTIPMPLELDGTVSGSSIPDWQKKSSADLKKKYGADNWYDFNISNYGTKWDAYDIGDLVHNDDGSITYRFDTAWSPPSGWLCRTAEMFPSLTLEDAWKYEGGGAGTLTICVDEGIENYTKMDDKEWYCLNDPWFKEELERIQTGDYDEVINEYAEAGEAQNSYLDEDLLKRIKDEDLPLFKNYEWWGDDRDTYRERMANINNAITK